MSALLARASRALAAVLGVHHVDAVLLQRAGQREHVADVVVDDQDPLARGTQLGRRAAGSSSRPASSGRRASARCRNSAVSSSRRSGASRRRVDGERVGVAASAASPRAGQRAAGVDDDRRCAQRLARPDPLEHVEARRRRAAEVDHDAVEAAPSSARAAPPRGADDVARRRRRAPSSSASEASRRPPRRSVTTSSAAWPCVEQALERARAGRAPRPRAGASSTTPRAPARSAVGAPAARAGDDDRDVPRLGVPLELVEQRASRRRSPRPSRRPRRAAARGRARAPRRRAAVATAP